MLSDNVRGVRILVASIGAIAALLVFSAQADAHRLDEYLQATRIAVDPDHITIEIDLTAGTSLASTVIGWIDTNNDGQLSAGERSAYAQQVVESVALSLDGAPTRLTLLESQFPSIEEIAAGMGTIHLRTSASVSAARSGRHVAAFVNSHHPEASVYLANALAPTSDRITIASQHRDPSQHQLTLEYEIAYGAWPWIVLLGVVLSILGFRSGLWSRLSSAHRKRDSIREVAPSRRG